MSTSGGNYNESEAQEILRRAAALQSSGAMSRQELIQAAGEIGITPEAVEEAEKDYQLARTEEELKGRYRSKRRHELFDSLKGLVAYGVIGWLLARNDRDWFWIAIVVVVYAIFQLLRNASLVFFENTDSWRTGFTEFKAKDAKRRSFADQKANDRTISDILQQTSSDKKLEVIKNLRETTGLPLNEAKNAVDDYYRRHPEVIQQRSR